MSMSWLKSGKFWRVMYSVGQFFSFGASSSGLFEGTTGEVLAGILGGSAGALKGYAFQGAEIEKNMAIDEKKPQAGYGPISSEPDATFAGSSSPSLLGQIICCCYRPSLSSVKSITAQVLFYGIDAYLAFTERYYVLRAIFALFTANPTSPLFWGILGVGLFCKYIFNATNETCETTQEIAKLCGSEPEETAPFYKGLFAKCGGSPLARCIIRKVGAFDHALNDDILPWFALIPQSVVTFALSSWWGLAIGLVSWWAAVLATDLTYHQTYFFEGKHTSKNLKAMAGPESASLNAEVPEIQRRYTAEQVAKARDLKENLKFMGPIHGIADAVPVILKAKTIFNGNTLAQVLAATSFGLFTAAVVAKGVDESEVKSAKGECDKIINNGPTPAA